MNDDSPESLYEQTHRPGPGKNPIGRAREIIDEIEGTRGADILLAEEWVDEMIQRMGDDQQSLSTFDYIDISRSTLLKEYHLDQRLVNRLIKAIFIYSFGVHELLTQLVRHYPQPSEMIAALWNMYLQSIESGDRCRYETAIKAINDGDGEIEGNRRQLLDERCEQVEAREAVLEEKARELEERRALIKAGNHMECDVEEMEERAALLMEQNKELREQGGRLEGEETDWRQTTVWYKGEIERLEREYMNNTGNLIGREWTMGMEVEMK
uniref:Uncharacterized protein n=1 Tax=Spongospora subterranea TaxID=70186 RepID=A0A0H5QLF2_9EUKA|eukprot:CRZ02186.1 hypothetical protein [Spongospora subterranea]